MYIILRTTESSLDSRTEVYKNYEDAYEDFKKMYLKEIKQCKIFDYKNSFFNKDDDYFQVSDGRDIVKMRIINV